MTGSLGRAKPIGLWDGLLRFNVFEILPERAEVAYQVCRRALELAPEGVPSGPAVIPLTPRARRDVGATGAPRHGHRAVRPGRLLKSTAGRG